MDAASVLVGVSLGLLALEGLGRVVPSAASPGRVVLCMAGVAASLATAEPGSAGVLATVDGVSRAVLLALFLLGAAGWQRPGVLGAAGIALAAAGAPAFLAGVAVCGALAVAGLPRESTVARPDAAPLLIVAVAALAAALLLQGGFAPRFAAARGGAVEGVWGALLLALALGGAGLLFVALPGGLGGMLGLYALARLLLDLPGPATPAWWGVPVLAAGVAGAVWGAWRAAGATALDHATEATGLLATGIAAAGLGAGLLGRGADLVPAATLAVSGALGMVLAWGAWGGLLCLCTRVLAAGAGSTDLSRMGGLLARAPGTGLALGLALLSLGAVPVSAGFGGAWTVLQAVFAAGRTGNEATLLMVACAAAALALALALAAAAAVRLAATVLAGAPRSARAAAMRDPPGRVRLALAGYAVLAALAGLLPGPLLWLVQPGVRTLVAAAPDGLGVLAVSATADAPGYVAPGLAVALAAAVAAAVVAGGGWRGTRPGTAAAWEGGFIEPGVARGVGPVAAGAGLPAGPWGRAALLAAAGALCVAVGWAAR